MADDSNTGVAVSATFTAGVVRWSVCWVRAYCLALFSLAVVRIFFFVSGLQLLVANAAPFAAVGCYLFLVLRMMMSRTFMARLQTSL